MYQELIEHTHLVTKTEVFKLEICMTMSIYQRAAATQSISSLRSRTNVDHERYLFPHEVRLVILEPSIRIFQKLYIKIEE